MRETQRKGDAAVAHAIALFTKLGYDISIPLTESAAYDLVIDFCGSLKRVQVRFSHSGKEVGLRRIHSNSHGYVVKRPNANAYDWLFILDGSGNEYLITRKLKNRSVVTPQRSDLLETVFEVLLTE
jgi:hypothetical protein